MRMATLSAVATFNVLAVMLVADLACAAELIQPPKEFATYKLSNMRVEKGITGDLIVFDYKRTREGKGVPRLAARTDEGTVNVSGLFMRFESSGTIRLEDRFARIRATLNRGRGGDGMEFYFVAQANEYDFSGKRYLISNAIRHGTMNTKLSARKLTKEELAKMEKERIARLPPETVPAGYTRASASTVLVPGAPVMYGSAGKWQAGDVVSLPTTSTVKIRRPDDPYLRTVPKEKWIAVSDETARQIRENPQQFSISVRTLPNGNLILADDVEPLVDPNARSDSASNAMSLLKGTPLMMEKYSKWLDVYFVSSDNVSARVLVKQYGRAKVENVSLAKLAIRKQTRIDMKADGAKDAFAANVAGFDNRPVTLPGESGSMASVGGFDSDDTTVNVPTPSPPKPEPPAEMRTWSDATGKFNIEAKFTKETDTDVFLMRADGKTIQVPIAKLSGADQEYLSQRKMRDENPFANVVEPSSANSSPGPISVGNLNYASPFQNVRTISDMEFGAKSVAISPDNRFVLMGGNRSSASLVDIQTGQTLINSGRMEHIGDVSVCGFTPDGKHAVIGGYKGLVEVYELNSKGQMKTKQQFGGHAKEVTSLDFSADGKYALTGGADKEARYWEVETGKQLAALSGFSGKVKATKIVPSGKLLLATDGEMLQVYDVGQSKVVRQIKVGRSWASGQAAAFSPNGLLLVTGETYDFHLWNLETFTELPVVKGSATTWALAFSPDNRHFFSGNNGVVNVWDAKTQLRVLSQPVGSSFYVKSIAVSRDGSLLSAPSAHRSAVVLKAAQ